jgi:hypothetical protein
MEQQDELFQLIKALSKSEKKFFTQYVNLYEKGSSPIYLQVFNFLNEEPDYNEERLFKKFRDQTFRKNYPVTKHYLKQLIIKTLRHGELTVREDPDLTVFVLDIKRLMAKGLMPMAKRMTEKLKEEAYRDEKFNDVLQLITMQRGLIYHGYYRHQPEINLDTLDEEEELLLEKMKQLRQMMNASLKLGSLMDHENGTLPDEMTREIEALGTKEYLQNFDILGSAKARHAFLEFWAVYYRGLNDYAKYYQYAAKKLAFVKNEKIPNTVSNWLIVGYYHYLEASLLTGNFTDFESGLTFLEEMELKSPFQDANRFQTVSIFSLLYYIMMNNEKKTLKYIMYSQEGLVRLAPFIHKSVNYTLRTTIAYAYLKLGKLDECLKEVNDLMALTNGETRRDYVGHVKVINLMLRYEMKEYNYLSYLLKNTYRFFVSYLYTTTVHKFIIAYLKDALKTKGRQELHEVNLNYLQMLKNLRFNPSEADVALVMMIEDFLTVDKSVMIPG